MPAPKKAKSGNWTISIAHNRQRSKLTLGKIKPAESRKFAANVEILQAHAKHKPGSIPVELESWIASLSKKHRIQLGDIGLLPRISIGLTVGDLIDQFLLFYEQTNNEQSTKRQMRSSFTNRFQKLLKVKLSTLEPSVPPNRPNAEPAHSEKAISILNDFQSWQRNFYAKSTWSKDNGRIRDAGRWAVKVGILDHNPFLILPKPGEVNEERNVYVPEETVLDAMDMCLDPDTRIVLALGRFAAFRTPSEARTLKWSMVDFEKRQLSIKDSKKRKLRMMPMFDRVFDELRKHQKATESECSRFVLTSRARNASDANNYNLIKEAIGRAGHDLWPRLRQNLRTSGENDLLDAGFDERKVTTWVGHTVKVSRKHYQKQTDEQVLRDIEKSRSLQ